MNTMATAKTYDFSTVKGMSPKQLKQHYQLYEGYVKKYNEIGNILKSNSNLGIPNATYSEIRSLKLGESYALDGIKLHELYFENLVGFHKPPSGKVLNMIITRYGSYEKFIQLLKDVALSMRGWAVLAIDTIDDNLHIFGLDAHDVGAIWCAHPLLVLDAYEHAYMIDFGIDRKKYIDTFIANINWDVVNNRLDKYYQANLRQDEEMYVSHPCRFSPPPFCPFMEIH